MTTPNWYRFFGDGIQRELMDRDCPPWRTKRSPSETPGPETTPAPKCQVLLDSSEIECVNLAILLQRPLLVTGTPGIGKSTLAKAIAYELGLGEILRWSINTKSTLQDGLYRFDAIGHYEATMAKSAHGHPQSPPESNNDRGRYTRLGPLGTALLPSTKPRVLLIDEIDKSDIDLPNDLLDVLERGTFRIEELAMEEVSKVLTWDNAPGNPQVTIKAGRVESTTFPIVVLTNNSEREFPAPFLRRCVRLKLSFPNAERLNRIVRHHLGVVEPALADAVEKLVSRSTDSSAGMVAVDQLLSAVFLVKQGVPQEDAAKIIHDLSSAS